MGPSWWICSIAQQQQIRTISAPVCVGVLHPCRRVYGERTTNAGRLHSCLRWIHMHHIEMDPNQIDTAALAVDLPDGLPLPEDWASWSLKHRSAEKPASGLHPTTSADAPSTAYADHFRTVGYLKAAGQLPIDWHPSWCAGELGAEWYGLEAADEAILRGLPYLRVVMLRKARAFHNLQAAMHAEGIADPGGVIFRAIHANG